MATHCSILVWKIPWTEEPGRLHAVHRITKNQTRLSNYTLNSGSLLLLFSRSEVLTLWDLMDCSTRVLCPLFSPGGYSESCPLSQWCYVIISSSITVFSSPFSFPVSGSSPVSQHFASGGQSIGASASVFPMNIQSSFTLGWTGFISLQSKGPSRVFSRTAVWKY